MGLNANSIPNLKSIAERLRNLIRLKGIDQNNLAKQLNITIQTLSKILNAKALPSTETLIKMSQYFDVSIDYILKGDENITSNLLNKYRKLSEEITDKIRDVEATYSGNEISAIINKVSPNNKTSIKDLIKIIVQIMKGDDEQTIHQLIDGLDDNTYNILRQLNREFIDSISKRQRRE